jgi:putative membrane protein
VPPLPEFHLHGDVLALVLILAVGYWYADRRLRPVVAPTSPGPTRWERRRWYVGVLFLWIASGWPIHDLAEETLFSFHMVEHLLIGYVVPPLLLTGVPRWLADATLGRRSVARVLRPLAHPAVAFFLFNGALVLLHWPEAVAWQNTMETTHFLFHALMFSAGVLLWLPVFSPTPAIPRMAPPMRMLFLFLNTIIPTVPASFLTFSSEPLYPVYGDAASAWGLSALADQTIAGLIMKLGGGFYLLGVIAWIWFRWLEEERRWDRVERELIR